MQSGSYEVTARPASTTGAAPAGRRQINSQDTHNHGVSREQESGCLPAPDILTVVGVAHRADRGLGTGLGEPFGVADRGVLLGFKGSTQHRLSGGRVDDR